MARLQNPLYRTKALSEAFLTMIRASRCPNSKFNLQDILEYWREITFPFNLQDILEYWHKIAFPSKGYTAPFSKHEIESQIQFIYKGLLEYQSNKLKGVCMARSKKSTPDVGKAERTYTSKKKTSEPKKNTGKKVIEKTGAAVDRRVYICETLILKKYTDEAIVSMSNRKFPSIEETNQKWVARLRCRLNNGKYKQFKFTGKIERKSSR